MDARAPKPSILLWYKDAVIYQLHVKSFFDSNDDGIGDFPGLTAKLDYIERLGVTTLWLLPFYPSPRRDDGYDIADYTDVHPDYGTMDDVRAFIDEAHSRGIRVITELVINHTSDQHAWFQRARRAPAGSPERDFYVWSDTDQKYLGTRIIFLDTEKSNWTWDPVANAYFWHRFYSHQPDLNFDNPLVLQEILKVMEFWLDLGIDGLRLDAVPYLVERDGTNNENLPETHTILKRIRAALDAKYPGRMLLAEANQWPEDTQEYFGEEDECHMAFHFPLMPRMYMAIAKEDRFPITDIMRQTPQIPRDLPMGDLPAQPRRTHARNGHRQRARLSVGSLRIRSARAHQSRHPPPPGAAARTRSAPHGTDEFAAAVDARHAGRLLRRRNRHGRQHPSRRSRRRAHADAMVARSQRRIFARRCRTARAAARSPIRCTATRRSTSNRRRATRIRCSTGCGACSRCAASIRCSDAARCEFLYPRNRKVFAYLRRDENETILCVANLARSPQAVELDLREFNGRVPIEMTGGSAFPPIGELTYLLTLPPYGFYWFELQHRRQRAGMARRAAGNVERIRHARRSPRHGRHRERRDARATRSATYCPVICRRGAGSRRKTARVDEVKLTPIAALDNTPEAPVLFRVSARFGDEEQHYLLPLGLDAGKTRTSPCSREQLALANVRRTSRMGVLTDAFAIPAFARILIDLLARNATVTSGEATTAFPRRTRCGSRQVSSTRRSAGCRPSSRTVRSFTTIASCSSCCAVRNPACSPKRKWDASCAVKASRTSRRSSAKSSIGDGDGRDDHRHPQRLRAQPGRRVAIHARLSEPARSTNTSSPRRPNRGDDEFFAEYNAFAAAIGRALGEVHRALAAPSDDPAFAPETRDRRQTSNGWRDHALAEIDRAFAMLDGAKSSPAIDELVVAPARATSASDRQRARAASRRRGDQDAHPRRFPSRPGARLERRRDHRRLRRRTARAARAAPRQNQSAARRRRTAAFAPLRRRLRSARATTRGSRRRCARRATRCSHASCARRSRRSSPPTKRSLGVDDIDESLLTLFVIEKAAYELCYELANRPDWVHVPLRGLIEIIDTETRA